MGFSDHVQPNISVRRGIIRGISIHGIYKGEIVLCSSREAVKFLVESVKN